MTGGNRAARRIAQARARRGEARTVRDPRAMASIYDRYRGQVGQGGIVRHVMPTGLDEVVLPVVEADADTELGVRHDLDEVVTGVRLMVGDGRRPPRRGRREPSPKPRRK